MQTCHEISENGRNGSRGKEELERSLSLLNATLESTADGILVVGLDGKIKLFNRRFVEIWGIPEGFLEGAEDGAALAYVMNQLREPESFVAKVKALYADIDAESMDTLEFKDGRTFERYSRPQRVGGRTVGRVWSFRDVTVRERALKQQRQSATRLKLLADVSRQLAEIRLDLGAILEASAHWVTGYFDDGCVIHLFSEDRSQLRTAAFHHVDPAALEVMNQLLPGTHDFVDGEAIRLMLQTGRAVTLAAMPEKLKTLVPPQFAQQIDRFRIHSGMIAPLRVAGQITGMITLFRSQPNPAYTEEDRAFFQEIADRVAVSIDNAQLYAAAQKAIQLREDFMSIASHELKTPLTPLKMQLQLLALFERSGAIVAQSGRARELQRIIGDAEAQITRLTRLVEDMLDAARLKTGRLSLQLEPVDLSRLVKEQVTRFAIQPECQKCQIELEAEEGLYAFCDADRIEQVVCNLLSNALKYGHGKPVKVRAFRQEARIILSVQDFGIGIAKPDQERIFGRFERAVPLKQFGGLGMGLYIARQIVQGHGGQLWVESDVGQGSTFLVEFPAKTA